MAARAAPLRPSRVVRPEDEPAPQASALVPSALARRARMVRPVCDLAALAGCIALFRGSATALASLVIALGLGLGSLTAPERRPVLVRAALVAGLMAAFLVISARTGESLDGATITEALLVVMVALLSALLAEHGPHLRGQLFGRGNPFLRRGIQDAARFEASLARLRDRRFLVVAIGIDGLDLVRELWGRSVADDALARVKEELLAWSAGRFPVAHVASDEFAAVLLDAGPGVVRAAAEEVSAALSSTSGDQAVHPSISVGWAPGGDAFTEVRPLAVWAEAREALAQARDLGGGSVVTANDRRYASGGGTPAMMRRVVAACPLLAGHEPVVDLGSGRVVAAVVAARPPSMPVGSVAELYATAREIGALPELARACRTTALEGSRVFPSSLPLHLGVSIAAVASVLADDAAGLASAVREMDRAPGSVVVELTDAGLFDMATLAYVAAVYRAEGFRIGVDCVDARWGGELLTTMAPDVLKLERSMLGSTVISAGARDEVSRLVAGATAAGALVVVKGIETGDLAERAIGLGITAGQGRPVASDLEAAA